MARREPVGFIGRPSYSFSGDAKEAKFIQCVDDQDPHNHEVWDFGDDGVTCELHPIAQVDVGAGIVREFATNYLTESGRRIPIFGRIYINGSVEWLGVPDFYRSDGPAWTANILDPHSSWGDVGTTTN